MIKELIHRIFICNPNVEGSLRLRSEVVGFGHFLYEALLGALSVLNILGFSFLVEALGGGE